MACFGAHFYPFQLKKLNKASGPYVHFRAPPPLNCPPLFSSAHLPELSQGQFVNSVGCDCQHVLNFDCCRPPVTLFALVSDMCFTALHSLISRDKSQAKSCFINSTVADVFFFCANHNVETVDIDIYGEIV